MATETARAGRRSATWKKVLLWTVGATAAVALGGFAYWARTCPCDGTPGFVLTGEVRDEPVADWSFANDVDLCQVQITVGWRPHSVNLNCMATPSGDLYLSCSFGERKYWCPRVGPDEPGRLRLDGVVYPVVLDRVTDASALDAAWQARLIKLQNPDVQARQPPGSRAPSLDTPRPDHWWTFRVRSAPPG